MGKSIFVSKTFWFNILTGAVYLASEVGPLVADLRVLGLDPGVADQIQSLTTLVNVIGNLILRTMTVEPVRLGR